MQSDTALFINGVYEGVFAEILQAGGTETLGEAFLQPYKGQAIRMLADRPPTSERPTRLYVSTTQNLSRVSYTAQIVRWEDKRQLSKARRREVTALLTEYQSGEVNLFRGEAEGAGRQPVNLLTIRELVRLDPPISATRLRKCSDGLPLKRRTRAGGWSEVYDDLAAELGIPSETEEALEAELIANIAKSRGLSDKALGRRLAGASAKPARVRVLSIGYRRNPDVIVAALRRAKGQCERCQNPAPFIRRSDGSPYLEVHHRKPLSQGGEDTLQNAAALCANCHREEHFGEEGSA